MRSGSVSSPCRNMKALNGLIEVADIAQELDAQLDDVGDVGAEILGGEDITVDQTVVARIRRGEFGKRPDAAQSNVPPSTTKTADRCPMAADELGRGVDHDVGAVIERPHEVRRRQCVIEHQRDASRMRHRGHGTDVERVQVGIADRLRERTTFSLPATCRPPRSDPARRTWSPSCPAGNDGEEVGGSAAQARGGNDLVARVRPDSG